MKKTVVLGCLLISLVSVHAQDYGTALGFRFGGPTGFTVKHFLTATTALDGILGVWDYGGTGFSVTGLYEMHKSLDPQNLKLYYGGGAHVGVWDHYYNPHWDRTYGGSFFGIDGVVGIEYTIKEIPLSLALDWNPRFTFYSDGDAWPQFGYAGLSVRYTMKK